MTKAKTNCILNSILIHFYFIIGLQAKEGKTSLLLYSITTAIKIIKIGFLENTN